MDLIACEYILHKDCRKMVTRPVRPQTDTTRGDPIDNLDKLISRVGSRVIDLDHSPGMGTAVKLYLGSGTNEASSETVKKRRQRLKKKLLDYYGEKISFANTY